ELDWIVMKALEKDRARRYQTADALAEDVRHYLHDEPVSAGPPSAWYRCRKFARRNRVVLSMAAVVAVLLTSLALVVHWRLREREYLARQRADETQLALDRLSEANTLIQRGHFYADSRQWVKAHMDFNRAVELRPDNSVFWFERGDFYTRL